MKDRFGQRLMHWRFAAVLPHLRGRVLDLGCGTNDLLRRYHAASTDPAAVESVGVDVYDWPGADLLVEDSSDLPYADASFDTVSVVAALNHIPNRREVLAEARRLLRPDGRLVLTMLPPTISRAWHAVRRPWDADQTERGMRPGEVYGLRRRQIESLLRDAGFEPAWRGRFMLGLNLLMVAQPVARPAAVSSANGQVQPVNGTSRPAVSPALAVARRRPTEANVAAVAER